MAQMSQAVVNKKISKRDKALLYHEYIVNRLQLPRGLPYPVIGCPNARRFRNKMIGYLGVIGCAIALVLQNKSKYFTAFENKDQYLTWRHSVLAYSQTG